MNNIKSLQKCNKEKLKYTRNGMPEAKSISKLEKFLNKANFIDVCLTQPTQAIYRLPFPNFPFENI